MKWKSKEEWENLKKGIGCPMCEDFPLVENEFSYLIKELKYSYVRLPKNQYLYGWTIVGLKRHANELFELMEDELLGFWKDVSLVAKVMDKIHNPVKIDYCIFGHHNPHIHCHLFVQKYENDPSVPIKQDAQEVFLNKNEYYDLINKMRKEIEKIN